MNLNAEIEASKRNKLTSSSLQHYVFGVVNHSLIEHYGSNYSDKCLQSSLGIQALLKSLGISSTLVLGEVCIPALTKGIPFQIDWQGFWGEHHHFWLFTEFNELIDLSISKINLHAYSKKQNRLDCPAIWWNDTSLWPYFIKYLPKSTSLSIELPKPDQEDLELFINGILTTSTSLTDSKKTIPDPILTGMDSLESLRQAKDEWASKCYFMSQNQIPLPDYIKARYEDLLTSYASE